MYFDDFSMFLTKIIIFAILSIIAYNILKKLLDNSVIIVDKVDSNSPIIEGATGKDCSKAKNKISCEWDKKTIDQQNTENYELAQKNNNIQKQVASNMRIARHKISSIISSKGA
tara:strand:+ start:180 stop:521 length:342 start_codon:yes stop_codon:yes gene_type:complete